MLGGPAGPPAPRRPIEPEAWWPSWSSRRTGFDHSVLRRDVPMLLDGGMRLIEPACLWLMHIALIRGRTRSRQTWRTYGEALYDWWQTLEANGWAWDEVGTGELAAYRDHMLRHPSGHTGRPYARSTINGRLRILSMFYRWCAADGLIGLPWQAGSWR